MALPQLSPDLTKEDLDNIVDKATTASNFLKAISHEGRLMILCHLVTGEKSVTELEELLTARQAAVSQQLSRLRLEGLVIPRREGKTIYYRLADDKPRKMLECVYDLFCKDDCSGRHSNLLSHPIVCILHPVVGGWHNVGKYSGTRPDGRDRLVRRDPFGPCCQVGSFLYARRDRGSALRRVGHPPPHVGHCDRHGDIRQLRAHGNRDRRRRRQLLSFHYMASLGLGHRWPDVRVWHGAGRKLRLWRDSQTWRR